MYKHSFVAGDEVAPIEIQLNATSRISSIAVRLHCTYYKIMCTQRLRLQIKTCRLVKSFVCHQKLFIPFCSFLYVHIRHVEMHFKCILLPNKLHRDRHSTVPLSNNQCQGHDL